MGYRDMSDEMGEEEAKLLDQARKRFKLCADAWSKQREREREDLRFQYDQWDPLARQERMGGDVGGVQVSPRPIVQIDLLGQPIRLINNQFTRAKLGVNLHPVSEETDKELAEIKQGLYRRIERDGQADLARGWGFNRASKAGLGWYRIVKRYDEDADPEGPGAWDQEIGFERILFQENVYVDPTAQKSDYSDARYLFVTAWVSEDEFKERWPDQEMAGGDLSWQADAQAAPEWVRSGEPRQVLIAEYWYKRVVREQITDEEGRKRDRETVTVYCAKISGFGLLEPVYEWDGKYFPFVPVIGEELIPVDGERRIQGMVRPSMDGQRLANFAACSLVEGLALEPKAPFMADPKQIAGYESQWEQANMRNFPYLPYNAVVDNQVVPPPQRQQVDGSRMTLAMQAFQESKGFVQSTSAVYGPSLGESSNRRDESGRKVLALQQQTEAGTSQFMDNWKLISGPCEARIVLDLIPHVYDRPGRVTSIVTGNDENVSKRIMLGQPYTTNEKGWPVAAQQGAKGAKFYDLRKGKFGIDIDVGRGFQTRLQEGSEMLGEIISKAPALLEVIGPTWLDFQDWPGAAQSAEILRKIRDQKYPFLNESDDENSPEALKAQLQALQGQSQQLQQAYQQAVQALQTDQAKHQAQVQVAQIKAQTEMELAKLKAQLELEIEQAKNAADITVARIKAAQQAVSDETELREEALATGLKIEAEREARREQMAHEVGMAEGAGRSTTVSRSRGSDSEREDGLEMSDGGSAERTEEDQPPQQAGA